LWGHREEPRQNVLLTGPHGAYPTLRAPGYFSPTDAQSEANFDVQICETV
jgi:hypothetical protein